MNCAERDQLTERAMQVLHEIVEITKEQIAVLRAGDERKMQQLDKELEQAVGRKERTLGALNQHQTDHGC